LFSRGGDDLRRSNQVRENWLETEANQVGAD